MTKLIEFNHDTLMHESGNVIKENINHQVKPYKKSRYISPGKRSARLIRQICDIYKDRSFYSMKGAIFYQLFEIFMIV